MKIIQKYKNTPDENYLIFANARLAIGTHAGTCTKYPSEDALPGHRLVCLDTDIERVKLCGSGDLPIGVTRQVTAKKEDPACVQLLGVCGQTVQIEAAEAVEAGKLLCVTDNGLIKMLPTNAGNYICVGLSLTGGEANQSIEVATNVPYTLNITE